MHLSGYTAPTQVYAMPYGSYGAGAYGGYGAHGDRSGYSAVVSPYGSYGGNLLIYFNLTL